MEFRKKNQIMCYMTEIGKIITTMATATADCCEEEASQEIALRPHLVKIRDAAKAAAYYAGMYFEEEISTEQEHAYSVDHPVEMLFDMVGNLLGVGTNEVDSFCIEWDCDKAIKVRTLELNLQLVLAIASEQE